MRIYSLKLEVSGSLILRITGLALSFVTTAILINKLGAANYGSWAAMTSLITWIQITDFGVGYVLKNRVATGKRTLEITRLVGGAFQLYSAQCIALSLLIFFFIDRLAIGRDFNTETKILYIGSLLLMPLTLGSAILQGLRKSTINALIWFMNALLWFTLVINIVKPNTDLLTLSIAYISCYAIYSIYQFIIGFKFLIRHCGGSVAFLFENAYIALIFPLIRIGARFILLQLSSVLLFSMGTYLTYIYLTPEASSKYDILYKFFQPPLLVYNIFISAYWSDISLALENRNIHQLKLRFLQLHLIAAAISSILGIFASIMVSPIVDWYTQGKIHIAKADGFAFFFLITVQMFSYAGAVFLNAAEKLNGQLLLAMFASILLMPFVALLNNNGYGFISAPIATTILMVPSLLYCNYIAYFNVIKKSSKNYL